MDPRTRARRERQGLRDFTQRVKLGSYLHLPLWLLVSAWIRLYDAAPVFFAVNTGFFLATTAVRVVFYRTFERIAERSLSLSKRMGQILVLIPGLQWSLLAVFAIHGGPMHSIWLPMLLVAVGLSTTGTIILSIDRAMRIWYPALVLAPSILALLVEPIPNNLLLGVMSTVMLSYVLTVTKVVYKDYWASLDAHTQLEDRAISLESLSMTDPLTQIANRLHFDRRLELAWNHAVKQGQSLSVLLVDLDHFKRINDTHGHTSGDECLKAAAQALNRGIHRAGDLLARWGGEEFIVLLPGVDAPAAGAVAQRLLRNVSSTIVPCGGTPVRLTCSIGVATVRPSATAPRPELIKEADKALYVAKQQGRNRVVVADAA